MKNTIIMKSETEFTLNTRGMGMTLTKGTNPTTDAVEWRMVVCNASNRAYNRGMPMPKFFKSLEGVEAKYKSWRGIALLVAC